MRTPTQLLLTFLLNAAWQIAAVTAFAAVGAWLLRGTSARCRHTLWVAALILSLGLPLMSAVRLLGVAVSRPRTPALAQSGNVSIGSTRTFPTEGIFAPA